MSDKKFRNCPFEIITENEVSSRFDTSDEFWERFGVQDKALQKKLGYYKVEHIDDPCLATVAVNPKDYLEYFESENVNKKHKGLEKGSKRMEFEHCAKRINSVREIESFGQLSPEKHTQA